MINLDDIIAFLKLVKTQESMLEDMEPDVAVCYLKSIQGSLTLRAEHMAALHKELPKLWLISDEDEDAFEKLAIQIAQTPITLSQAEAEAQAQAQIASQNQANHMRRNLYITFALGAMLMMAYRPHVLGTVLSNSMVSQYISPQFFKLPEKISKQLDTFFPGLSAFVNDHMIQPLARVLPSRALMTMNFPTPMAVFNFIKNHGARMLPISVVNYTAQQIVPEDYLPEAMAARTVSELVRNYGSWIYLLAPLAAWMIYNSDKVSAAVTALDNKTADIVDAAEAFQQRMDGDIDPQADDHWMYQDVGTLASNACNQVFWLWNKTKETVGIRQIEPAQDHMTGYALAKKRSK